MSRRNLKTGGSHERTLRPAEKTKGGPLENQNFFRFFIFSASFFGVPLPSNKILASLSFSAHSQISPTYIDGKKCNFGSKSDINFKKLKPKNDNNQQTDDYQIVQPESLITNLLLS